MTRFFTDIILFVANITLLLSCSSSDDSSLGNKIQIDRDANIQLVFDDQDELVPFKETIENLLTSANMDIQRLMPIDDITIRVTVNPNASIPEIGFGGFNPNANEVLISIDPTFNNLQASFQAELPAMIAHEMHHAKRRRSVGYGNTLLQAIVSEGLADHFSMEVTGIEPPRWAIAVQGQALQDWIATASQSWNNSSYDHATWFFGTTEEIPRWLGYAMGFELVEEYLVNHIEIRPSNLYDEPANSFLP